MEIKKKYVYLGASAIVIAVGIGIYFSREKIYQHFDYKTDLLLLSLAPKFRKKIQQLLSRARDQGMELRVISAHRDCMEQNKLYAQGRTTPGRIVTNARCGKSTHNYKRAVDVVEFKNGKPLWKNLNWEKIGQMGEALGLEWGGRWRSIKDKPHFQDLGGKTIASLYREYQRTGKLTT